MKYASNKSKLLHTKVRLGQKIIWEHLNIRIISKSPITYLLVNNNMAFEDLVFQSANLEKKLELIKLILFFINLK